MGFTVSGLGFQPSARNPSPKSAFDIESEGALQVGASDNKPARGLGFQTSRLPDVVGWRQDESRRSYQNLLLSRAPFYSILGFVIRTYKKVGYGMLIRSSVSQPVQS